MKSSGVIGYTKRHSFYFMRISQTQLEAEMFFPSLKDALLPQLITSKKSLPKELKDLVERVEHQRKAIYAVVPVTTDEIRASREMKLAVFTTFMVALEKHFEELPEKVKVIAGIILSTRNELRKIHERSDDEMSERHGPAPQTVRYFRSRLKKIIRKIEQEKLFDFRTVEGARRFPELPDEVKFRLLFPVFEALAAEQGILPEDAMDSKSNRMAVSAALAELLKVETKVTAGFYSNVASGQRNQAGGPKRQGLSLWQKYRLAQQRTSEALQKPASGKK